MVILVTPATAVEITAESSYEAGNSVGKDKTNTNQKFAR
jgi:hypothetical protein